MSEPNLSPLLQRLKVASLFFIPLIAAVIGNSFANAIKEKEIQARYIELAVNILNQETNGNAHTKKWAVDVINEYSKVKIDTQTRSEMINNGNLGSVPLNKTVAGAYKSTGFEKASAADYPAALSDLNNSTALNPKDARAYYLKGSVLLGLKRYKEAIDAIDTALLINPKEYYANYNLARVYWAIGEKDKAFDQIEIFLKGEGQSGKIYMLKDKELIGMRNDPRISFLLK